MQQRIAIEGRIGGGSQEKVNSSESFLLPEIVEDLVGDTVYVIFDEIILQGKSLADPIEGASEESDSEEDRIFFNIYHFYVNEMSKYDETDELIEVKKYDTDAEKEIVEIIRQKIISLLELMQENTLDILRIKEGVSQLPQLTYDNSTRLSQNTVSERIKEIVIDMHEHGIPERWIKEVLVMHTLSSRKLIEKMNEQADKLRRGIPKKIKNSGEIIKVSPEIEVPDLHLLPLETKRELAGEIYPASKVVSGYARDFLGVHFSLNKENEEEATLVWRSLNILLNGVKSKIERRQEMGYSENIENEINNAFDADAEEFFIARVKLFKIIENLFSKNQELFAKLILDKDKIGKDSFAKAVQSIKTLFEAIFDLENRFDTPHFDFKQILKQKGLSPQEKFLMIIAYTLDILCKSSKKYVEVRKRKLGQAFMITDLGFKTEEVSGKKSKEEIAGLLRQYIYAGSSKGGLTTHLVFNFPKIQEKIGEINRKDNLNNFIQELINRFLNKNYRRGGDFRSILNEFIRQFVIVDINNLKM